MSTGTNGAARALSADVVERIQAEELSTSPSPGRLRAADVIQIRT